MNQSYETLAASTAAHSSIGFVSQIPHKSGTQGTGMTESTAQWETNSQDRIRKRGLYNNETETTLDADRRV